MINELLVELPLNVSDQREYRRSLVLGRREPVRRYAAGDDESVCPGATGNRSRNANASALAEIHASSGTFRNTDARAVSQRAPCTIRAMSRRVGGPAATLPEGVYEHLVTEELARHLEAASGIARLIEPLDDADSQATFARHVGRVVARALSGLPAAGADELIRKVLDHLAGLVGEDLAELVRDQRLQPPPSRLMAVHRGAVPDRPTSPLATSTLLTRKRLDPTLGHELVREIATADEVDAIIAFVTVGGVRAIHDALHEPHEPRPGLLGRTDPLDLSRLRRTGMTSMMTSHEAAPRVRAGPRRNDTYVCAWASEDRLVRVQSSGSGGGSDRDACEPSQPVRARRKHRCKARKPCDSCCAIRGDEGLVAKKSLDAEPFAASCNPWVELAPWLARSG